jgi:hypothetical protein
MNASVGLDLGLGRFGQSAGALSSGFCDVGSANGELERSFELHFAVIRVVVEGQQTVGLEGAAQNDKPRLPWRGLTRRRCRRQSAQGSVAALGAGSIELTQRVGSTRWTSAFGRSLGESEPLSIEDITPFVKQQRASLATLGTLLVPEERVYLPSREAARAVGIDNAL